MHHHRLHHMLGIAVLCLHTKYLFEHWGELGSPLQWAGIAFILLFVEFNFQHAIAICFAVPGFIMMIPSSFIPPELWQSQFLIFLVLVAISFSFRARILKFYLKMHETESHQQPTQRVLGNFGVCEQEIDGWNRAGVIRVNGDGWRALEIKGRNVPVGAKVTVIGRQDTTLLISAESEDNSKIKPILDRYIGANAVWTGNGSVMLANLAKKAVSWPPGTHLDIGQAVKVVGTDGSSLLVERNSSGTISSDLSGAIAVCRDEINGLTHTGSVTLNHEIWSARSQENESTIEAGTPVRVIKMDGAILIVEHAKPAPDAIGTPDSTSLRPAAPEA